MAVRSLEGGRADRRTDGRARLHIRRPFLFRGESLKIYCIFSSVIFVGKVNKNEMCVSVCLFGPHDRIFLQPGRHRSYGEKLRTHWLSSEP